MYYLLFNFPTYPTTIFLIIRYFFYTREIHQNATQICPTGLSPRHRNTGKSIKPKQWRLNDPIKSGQDKAIRVSLIAVEMEWRLAGIYIVVYMYQETRSSHKENRIHKPVRSLATRSRGFVRYPVHDDHSRRKKAAGVLAREKRERVRK